MKRDFLSVGDLTREDLDRLIEDAATLKAERRRGFLRDDLKGKALAMIFEKASTRTRISFEVGIAELGGYSLFLNPRDTQLGRGEEVRDTARVISRYVAGVMIRARSHQSLQEFSRYAEVPVINGLSDREHPCQILADIFTITEYFGDLEGVNVAWIGDGNNVCNSWILAAPLTGVDLRVASPARYGPDQEILSLARKRGGKITLMDSPSLAAKNADVLYTDVWVSMGDEEEGASRMKELQGYSITPELVETASPRAIVMHCLPAHRGEEIAEEVLESPQSVVWEQAENRLHAQKALLLRLMGTGRNPG
ncbi:MAG: ornithine carbamoyltransferase [Methanomicrobiales archaeon]|nr:ornithine carbamoyltransferase [Methanomicrobiales archaeon]